MEDSLFPIRAIVTKLDTLASEMLKDARHVDIQSECGAKSRVKRPDLAEERDCIRRIKELVCAERRERRLVSRWTDTNTRRCD